MSAIKLPWYAKEDSWANIIGLFLVVAVSLVWIFGDFSIFDIFRLKFSTWSGVNLEESIAKLGLTTFLVRTLAIFIVFALAFYVVTYFLGKKSVNFIIGFAILFLLSLVVSLIGANSFSKEWQLETPLIALVLGLLLSNLTPLPQWFRNTLLTEFYVKIGIVLMGATLPLTLLINAGGVAILQACIITIVTFFSILFFATKVFKLDPSFGATLGAGGSICGVSAAIVIGNACEAKKEHISVVISIVVLWAVAMVIVMPFVCRYLGLDMGVAGAWIGTSEFADAAGLAAAQSLGDERAVAAFTLIKVIGRDMFVGVWAVLVAFLSVTVWNAANKKNAEDDTQVQVVQSKARLIWEKFPKFILGFIVASILGTIFLLYLPDQQDKAYQKEVLGFVKELRNWVFTWTFLCIGLSTQFSKIIEVGYKPFVAFTLGVAINVPLGFILSQYIFVDFWTNFMK